MSEPALDINFILIFGPKFSADIRQALQHQTNETVVYYILGTITLVATASVRIGNLLYENRRRTLQGLLGDACDDAHQELVAACGLVAETPADAAAGRLRCFHCDIAVVVTAANLSNVWTEHNAASPACYLAKMGLLVMSPPSADSASIQTDSRRYQAVLRRLRQVLASPVIDSAACYGADANYLRLCAARNFMRNDCNVIDRPGDLLSLVYETETVLPADEAVCRIDLQRILDAAPLVSAVQPPPPPQQPTTFSTFSAAAAATPAAATVVVADSQRNTSRQMPAAPQYPQPASSLPPSAVTVVADTPVSFDSSSAVPDDDRCLRCRSRTRNRVTLPCAHFVACDRCLESLSRCPKCNSTIVATITAYIT